MEFRDLSAQFKAMLLQCIPIAYIRALKHPQLGFANATPMAIMAHLFQFYGEIKASDLMETWKSYKPRGTLTLPLRKRSPRQSSARA